jgi:alcohol dehydrogenase YqhD (iron-dependent ADH family)
VPAWHTAAGAADIMSHTFEQYLVAEGNTVTDGLCEAVLRTVIENTPKAIANPEDYDARSELMLASSFGCCGLLSIGRTPSPWPCHGIEHEISAFHDITHGAGLAIITPHWMRYSLTEETAPRFAQYGVRVWGLDAKAPAMETALKAIEKTAEFFASIGIPAHLSELGVTSEHFEAMADHVIAHWYPLTGAIRPIDKAGILKILTDSL